jgi:ELWxxDGT repeat protein
MRNSRFYSCILLLTLSLTCICSGLIADARAASVPVLVKDINTQIKDNSNIRNLAAGGSTLFFTAFDLAHGDELWKSNGTAAGTVLVKDILPGSRSSYHDPNFSTYWNGFLYFEAYGLNGWSLWKSDGSAANTVEVSADVDPGEMVIFKNALYFKGYGDGLWKSDGTTAGTVAVLGGIGSLDNLVVASANRLYFTIGNDLWTSDGTDVGTVVLQSDIYPTDLVSVSGTLYFNGWDDTNGYRLWTSNGTTAGTVVVNYAADPNNLIEVNGTLYFSANDPVAGASLVKLVPGGVPTVVKSSISPINPFNWNGVLYFAYSGDLWKSDGTLAGTVIVKADCYPSTMMNIGATLYFEGWDNLHGYELWKSDGTTAGTGMVKDINPGAANSSIERLTNVNGTLYLTATEAATGTQLWKSNGTEAGTVLVQNLSPGTEDGSPDKFFDVNGTLYFPAYDYDNGTKLWQSNGTAAGTAMVPGVTGSNFAPLANAGGTLYFASNSDDLWKRVGSSPATLVKAGVTTNDPKLVCYINGILYFRGWDSTHGWELWKSDGTEAGTVMVKEIRTGTNGSEVQNLVKLGTTLYFIAYDGTNRQLWKSNGTDAGTVRVSTAITNVYDLTVVNDKLFFQGNDASNTNALWVSNGTEGGTTVLMNNISPDYLTAVGNTLFFEGWTSPLGYELWKSDGTVAGTINLKNINTTGSANPRNLTNVNGTLYFSVWNTWEAPSHDQLWKSDGTPAGTVLVKDMPADYGYTSIESLTSVHGVLTFVFQDKSWAATHDDSAELWMSNGTAAGTVKVKDIFTGDYGSAPANLTMANTPPNGIDKEALFFSAIDPLAGRELFILDFTPPVSAITSPANGAYLRGTSFTISGTTSDSMPGTGVNAMQVSINNGSSWDSATYTPGAASWSYTWNNPADGVYTIKSQATDLATNVQNPLASITVTVDNTLPAVMFTMPTVYHSLTVPITTFTATDTNGITHYCLTSTNSYAGCAWTTQKPTSVPFAGEGSNTVYAWAKDPAGNVSAQHGVTVTVSLPHTLNVNVPGAGDGSGSVLFVQKSLAFSSNYTTTVYSFDPVKLQATPAQYSVFGGWSGFCAGTGECNYTIPTVAAGGSTHTTTATFNFDSAHAVFVSPNYYTSILGAYDNPATINGSDIRIWGIDFGDILLLDGNKEVTLVGGDNQAHNAYTGTMTTVPGPMTIKNGSVTIENMAIK